MRLHARATEDRHRRLVLLILSLLFALVLSQAARAQSTTDAVYQVPDAVIVDLVDVLPTQSVPPSPERYRKPLMTDSQTTE